MPVKRSKKHEIIQRRSSVAELYLKGWTQATIAQHLGVRQPTISSDLAVLHREWRESALRDFDAIRETQLQKLEHLEREAWAAYDRSAGTRQRKRMVARDGVKISEVEQWEEAGDPRYMKIVQDCIAKRCELLDIKAPLRMNLRLTRDTKVETLSDEDLEAIIRGDFSFDGPPDDARALLSHDTGTIDERSSSCP
jgi:hypothetical protein